MLKTKYNNKNIIVIVVKIEREPSEAKAWVSKWVEQVGIVMHL